MRYRILFGSAAILALGAWSVRSAPPTPTAALEGVPKGTLADLFEGRSKIVDLTWTLNDKSPYWPAENYQPFKLTTIATLEKNGVLSKSLSFPEHLGTHLDAPNHFEKAQPSVERLTAEQLFAPGVVIDVSLPVESDADYRVTVADIEEWEKHHGRISDGAVVLLRTGWGRHWTNFDRYKNQDVRGKMHFPGYSAEAARWLVEKRNVRGVGIDTLSVDYGMSTDFAVHHVINGAGRYGLENVAQLDKLPARGFGLIIAPIKVEAGTGGPTRIFAVL
jgi:kynurenine formamidase